MEILKKIKSYSSEAFLLSTLLLIFAILTFIYLGHMGSPLIDCGREAYIPSAMLRGDVLYKDIFILYGPLSYQLNAFFYSVFGQNLNTLYVAGLIDSLIILFTIYLISRTVTSNITSWMISLLILILFIFNYFITNYIFPYAYAITYALTTFLLSVLLFIYYIKYRKPWLVPPAFLFISISILSKIEYSLFLIILALMLIARPLPKKYLLASILSLLIIPAISLGTLFSQGLNINDVLNYIHIMYNYSHSSALEYFYKMYTGFFVNRVTIFVNFLSFIMAISLFWALIAVIYPALLLNNQLSKLIKKLFKLILSNNILKILFVSLLSVGTIIFILFLLPASLVYIILPFISKNLLPIIKFIQANTFENIFSWLPVSTTIILLIFILQEFINKATFNSGKNTADIQTKSKESLKFPHNMVSLLREFVSNFSYSPLKNKILIFLAVVAIISTIKSYFFVDFHVFGTFILPLTLIINVVFLIDKLPDYISFLDRKVWKASCLLILGIVCLAFSFKFAYIARYQNFYPIKQDRGTIYAIPEYGYTINKAVDYIKQKTPANSKVLMIPEGVIVNFLADRPSDGRYYSLLPNYIEAFGEDNIVEDFKKNPPDYILLNTRRADDYGFTTFCRSYGFKICKFITTNYSLKEEFLVDPKYKTSETINLKIKVFKKSNLK